MNIFSTDLNDDGILTIIIDVKNESMNVFNQQIIEEFSQLYEDIESDTKIKAVIFMSGKKDCFIAGADVKMLQKVKNAAEGTAIVSTAHVLLQKISQSKKPFIAAIDGVCLGAGYELSLACDYRIATDNPSTKIGLPEVMLGLLPGATGTSKLTRLINLPNALDIILTGKQLNAKRALHLGMIDEVVPAPVLHTAAEANAKKLITQTDKIAKPSLLKKILTLPFIKDFIINKARQHVIKKTHGLYPAPLFILDLIQQTIRLPLDQALALEAKKFGELTITPQAKQLINIYFATTELKKESFTSKNTTPKPVNKIGILGGGLMGAGIATVSIDKAKASVRMKDIKQEGLRSAQHHINHYFQQRAKRKILSREQAIKKANQFTGTLDYSGFAQCELIIEAVFEDITLKHQMVSDVEALDNEDIIFASNTSSIPITNIAEKAKRPENIIGMHYFSPVEKMPLLEIIKHPSTSDQTLATAVEFGRKQGKTVIVVNDGAGFYANRILAPYLNAAMELGLQGVPLDAIDNAMVKFGFPVGPFKLLDEVGIDVGSKIIPVLEDAFGERMESSGVEKILLKNKRYGKKVNKGFYLYDNKKGNSQIDETVYKELNITPHQQLTDSTIVDYCIYRLLNEAAICLEENIVCSPRDGDIGAIFGIGFPPFLGGPFRYMDTIGISTVVKKLHLMEKKYGVRYQPASSLIKMAEKNRTFY